MSGRRSGALAICHVSAADQAVRAIRSMSGGSDEAPVADAAQVDLLCYGRASEDLPPPAGARLIRPPVAQGVFGPRAALGLIATLYRRRYELAALSQPDLGLSWARGLLLAFSFLVGGRRAVVLDPTVGRVRRRVTAGLAGIDLGRWIVLQLAGQAISGLVAPGIESLARTADYRGRRVESLSHDRGSVLYLRTDLDLAARPLRAGGSVAHTEGVLRALMARGHDVSFASTGEVDGVPPEIVRSRLPALLRGNVPTEIAELLSGVWQGVRLRRLPAPSGFIYQRYSLNNLAGVLLSRRWRVPLVLEANCAEAKFREDFSRLRYPRLAYACERLILRRADLIAAISDNAAADLLARGAPGNRVRVVPNGVSVERFARAEPQELPFGSDAFVVCFVGLFYPWHGARFLAEAFARLYREHGDARLLLVGDGEEMPMVRSLLERKGAIAAACFTGMVSRAQAPRFMAAADVLVSPHANVHRFVGSPIKLFEYMAAGKPIVATRVAQLEEVLVDEETALLVAPEDPTAMATALERLYLDRALGQRLGASAAAAAAAMHSWDVRLAALLDGAAPRPA
jgi:glycosyltransferase involved in cell wall biosynthesis